jgi:hypothetical protein
MNFVSDAIEFLQRLSAISARKPELKNDAVAIELLIDQLRYGVKFLLPLHGEVGVSNIDTDLFRLTKCPYPVMVFEYETVNTVNERLISGTNEFYGSNSSMASITPSSKRLIVVTDGEALGPLESIVKTVTRNDSIDGVLVQPVSYYDEMDLWVPSPIGIWIPRINEVELITIEGRQRSSFKSAWIPLHPDAIRQNKAAGVDMNTMARDCHEEVTVTIATLLAINARNVNEISITPSEKLNRKRRKTGKPPFFEYKVLDIFLGNAIRDIPSGHGRRNAAIQQWLRNPPRLHTVSGHFKRRKTGIFWWHSHMRSKAEHGVIVKDYRVKTK